MIGVTPFGGGPVLRQRLPGAGPKTASSGRLSSGRQWWRTNVPMMRATLEPSTKPSTRVFGALAEARRTGRTRSAGACMGLDAVVRRSEGLRNAWLGDLTFLDVRINADSGEFIGVLRLAAPDAPASLLARMARGDRGMYERMHAVMRPARRPANILFADPRPRGCCRDAYRREPTELVRSLTDLIDSEVIRHRRYRRQTCRRRASALFLVEQLGNSEADTAAAASPLLARSATAVFASGAARRR